VHSKDALTYVMTFAVNSGERSVRYLSTSVCMSLVIVHSPSVVAVRRMSLTSDE